MAVEAARRQRRKVLTDKMVAELPLRPTPYADPELPKHYVRVRSSGTAFTVIARDPYGKQKWVKTGNAAEIKITESREIARAVIKRIERGEDPFPPPPVKPDTVAAVVEMYFKRFVEARGLRTAAEKRRIIERHVLPVWRNRPFAGIGRGDIAKLCDAVVDAHGDWVADTVQREVVAIQRWYAGRADGYTPPFIPASMKRVDGAARKRKRTLDDDEIRRVWAAAGGAGTYGALIKVLLLTGQRREKVVTMRWSDLSPEGVWTIPTVPREKNNPGVLRLPKAAIAIINSLPRFVSNPHVFAASRGAGPIRHFATLKADFDKACGVKNWTLHDLRRCSRSLMSRARVPNDHAERVLGHAREGVEAVYDRFEYDSEKAEALAKLAALVETILAGPHDDENVVPLHKAAVS
jgi:integrase